MTPDIRWMRRALSCAAVILASAAVTPSAQAQTPPKFKVLAFYNGTWDAAHISYVKEANQWFPQQAALHGFSYTSTNNWSLLNASNLAQYQVVMFLDDSPPAAQRAAFQQYMQNGGAWFGFHVCAFNTDPATWDWYHNTFLGTGAFRNNTWKPTTAVLRVEDRTHASTVNLPATFTSAVSEWYSWNRDLRTNTSIRILASVDPSSFPLGTDPNQSWTSGYYPILWTNRNYKMLYANFGHNAMDYATNTPLSSTFASETQNRFIIDGLMWLGGASTSPTPTPTPTSTPRPVVTATPTATGTPTPTPCAGCAVEITPGTSGVTASTSDGNLPGNTVDNNLTSRWSANGDGAWIQYNLGGRKAVSHVGIAVYNGNTRRNRFDLQVSNDGAAWTNVLVGRETSGTTTLEERFDLPAGTEAAFVRYVGHMSNVGTFNSLSEVSVFGGGTTSPTPTPTPTGAPVDVTPGASGVTASANDGNLPANTVDNNFATRWSANGDGQWIQYDLGVTRNVTSLQVAWYQGNVRRTTFDVAVAGAPTGPWTTLAAGQQSSGTTTGLETYDVPNGSGRYVRVTGHGNSVNAWNSATEVNIFAVP